MELESIDRSKELEEYISNNFGSWKEWDDADTLEMEVRDKL